MFNKIIFICALTLYCLVAHAQIFIPVKWDYKSKILSEKEAEIIFTAKIDNGWHVYSQFIKEGGPIPTSFHFEPSTSFELIGKTVEQGKVEEEYDPNFNMTLKWFSKKAVFVQKVKLLTKDAVISGYFEFMTCNDERCLPPEKVEFKIVLSAQTPVAVVDSIAVTAADTVVTPVIDSATDSIISNGTNVQVKKFGTPVSDCIEPEEADKSIWMIFVLGFIGGFIALLTPCVFPMIPLTVSFFTKRVESGGKGAFEAVFYGFSIGLIYFLLSVPFLLWDIPPDILNEISTNVWVNVFFFAIFIVFAISFFGYFEITLPSSLASRADSASGAGGIIGIFFMALTLAIVSFSCTGPILGTLLVGSLNTSGGSANLAAGMTGFGIALGLPFALFAAFPKWLSALPKSGGWLNTVKVVLGFIEVALALKFLSNADLVAHWGLLKREVFLALWIITGLAMALYLFGKLRFPHDTPPEHLSKGRVVTALLTLAFVIYLVPGLWGTNLRWISGFPPPMFYSIFETKTECPLGLPCFHDYDEAVVQAKKENKPMMIDFTGWACVNCRKMEENVWVDPEVYERLMKKYILVSLYVDDKRKLADEVQYISDFSGKKIVTVGNLWSDFQAKNFNSNSQPFYVLLSPQEQLLVNPVGYTPDVSEFVRFLDCGLGAYKEIVVQ